MWTVFFDNYENVSLQFVVKTGEMKVAGNFIVLCCDTPISTGINSVKRIQGNCCKH